jgi:hypothetical protein
VSSRSPLKYGPKRSCPGCGTEARTFWAEGFSDLQFMNHKDAGGYDYCRYSRVVVDPRESR